MGTITTTTNTTPLIWPSTTLIDRSPLTGHLWAMVKASTANTYELWRSTDNGVIWALVTSQVRASIQEISSLHIPMDGHLFWAFRTYEGGQDRIYTQRIYIKGSTVLWGDQVLLAAATAASAGAVYTGMDINSVIAGGLRLVVVAVGTTSGSRHGVVMMGETIDQEDVPRVNFSILGGTRWWYATGSGRITPSLEIEHVGDNKTGYPAHLWVTWGRTQVYVAKMAWAGGGWVGPTSPVKLNPATLSPAQDSITGRWDGGRLMVVYPDPVATSTVRVIERNRANTATVQRQSPVHPTGVVRHCSASYDTQRGDLRVYAVGTSTAVLYYVDFIRATGVWTSWAQVTATALLGVNNFSVRRATFGNARYDVLTAHSGAPNTIVHTSQVVTYAPNPPTWDVATIGYPNGGAADVAAALNLAWVYTDPDPADTQSAWALQRRIGAGAAAYFRASDSTWQPAEVKNTGTTPSRTLASGWGLDADAPHAYAVKVWDSSGGGGAASTYSADLVLIPSTKVNPVVTAPAAAAVITADTVTVTWTAASQTAYRITLATNPGGVVVYDSGWRSGTDLAWEVPYRLPDLTGWTVTLQTRNSEGLASTVQSVNFTVDYLEPPVPTVLASPVPTKGVIRVAITNPAPSGGQPALASQDLWRRLVGDTSTGVEMAVGLLAAATFEDWQAVSGVPYEYRVLARGVNGTSIFGAWTA